MVEPVSGYRTTQGRFYETQREADLSEAYHQLRFALIQTQDTPDVDNIFAVLRQFPVLTQRYINALIELLPDQLDQPEATINDINIDEVTFETPDATIESDTLDQIDSTEPIHTFDTDFDRADASG